MDFTITTGSHLYEDRINFWSRDIQQIHQCTDMRSNGSGYITLQTPLGGIKGIVRDVENNDVFEFRKIPFAKPPIGNLRFEKPEKYGIWAGTLDATKFGPSCYQTLGMDKDLLQNQNISEDCLHLNIYVPFNISCNSKKSVMVWIHGGGFQGGQGMLYDGSYLAVTGSVIVVTINYRLGVNGFFSTGDSVAKGNYGLWDQIMAIRWVQENIEHFGGNSQSITIFGESAGAVSVGLLCLMPINKGLFHRAIQQSGTAYVPRFSVSSTKSLSRLGTKLNCPFSNTTLLVQCMKGLSADLFLTLDRDMLYSPVVDGELLTDVPINLLDDVHSEANLFFQSIDVIIGTVSSEGSLLVLLALPLQYLYGFNMSDGMPRRVLCDYLAPDFTLDYNDTRVGKAACEYYGKSPDPFHLSMDIVNAYSDYYFHYPAFRALRLHNQSKTNSKRYQYMFSRPSPKSLVLNVVPPWFSGAGHGDELVFEFMMFPLSSEEKGLATHLMLYWSNFAKNG